MNKLFATACIIGTALVLSACESSNSYTYDSGASFATGRTAGEYDGKVMKKAHKKTTQVFRSVQSK